MTMRLIKRSKDIGLLFLALIEYYIKYRNSDWLCLDCHTDYCENYMLLNANWEGITTDKERDGLLCLSCMRKRFREVYGRDLNEDDFTNVPANNAIRLGIEIGQRLELEYVSDTYGSGRK